MKFGKFDTSATRICEIRWWWIMTISVLLLKLYCFHLAGVKLLFDQCLNIVDWTLGDKLQWLRNRNLYIFMHLNFSSWNWRPFCLGPNVLSFFLLFLEFGLCTVFNSACLALCSSYQVTSQKFRLAAGPLHWQGLISISAWMSNHTPRRMWDKITCPFPNFLKIWEWICNFIPYFTCCMITYPCWAAPSKFWKWICNFIPYFIMHVITYPCWD